MFFLIYLLLYKVNQISLITSYNSIQNKYYLFLNLTKKLLQKLYRKIDLQTEQSKEPNKKQYE